MFRVMTFNANGIRSAAKKGFFTWFETQDVEKTFNIDVASIINLHDLLAFMDSDTDMAKSVASHKAAVAAYRERYGA